MYRRGARSTFDSIEATGRTPVGMFVGSSDPAMVEVLAISGYDFVIIDGEHSTMGPHEMLPLVRAAEIHGAIPICRIWEGSRPLIQKVLDLGAEGVVIPHVESAEDVAAAIAATRFPADGGVRSMCPTTHASGYTMARWGEYVEHSRTNFLVIPIIESARGVENLEEILQVDGLEYIFFGHGDLSVDLGVAMDSDVVAEHWRRSLELVQRYGKKVMVNGSMPGLGPDDAHAVVQGMDLMFVSEFFTAKRAEVGAAAPGAGVGR